MTAPLPAEDADVLAIAEAGGPLDVGRLRSEPGRRYAQLIASCNGHGVTIEALREAFGAETAEAVVRQLHAVDLQKTSAELPRSQRRSYATLQGMVFPEQRWTVEGLIPEGLGWLAGRPKLGKSWLAMQLACAVGSGGIFLGRQVRRATAWYYALEDSPRRLQQRSVKQQWPADAAVEWAIDLPTGGLAALAKEIAVARPQLVVVDTFSRAKLRTPSAERLKQSDVDDMTLILDALQQAAITSGCTVLLLDHHRKRGEGGGGEAAGDVLDDILGSTAKAAVSDFALGLYRERGQRSATVKLAGRDLDAELDLAIEFAGDLGTWQIVARSTVETKILEAMERAGAVSTTKELAEVTGLDAGLVSRTLGELVGQGKVVREPKKGKAVPYRLLIDCGKGSIESIDHSRADSPHGVAPERLTRRLTSFDDLADESGDFTKES